MADQPFVCLHLSTADGHGNGLRAITSDNECFWDPVLSNDGSRLALVSKVGGNTEIFVARSDGLRLIYKPAGQRQILFVADTAGNRLYQLTASDYNAWSPDWAR
ncbi:MAG: hypothetical protein N2439_03320 [Anaerolineae bacterium]|nr:hypothetical protein [Anaerolineae bacterium]